MRKLFAAALTAGLLLVSAGHAPGEDPAPAKSIVEAPVFTHTEDIIYARKFGTALTMDVFTPKKNATGAAVILVVSGGWFSDHGTISFVMTHSGNELVKHGYTVFAVVHGSQPRFIIPEAI